MKEPRRFRTKIKRKMSVCQWYVTLCFKKLSRVALGEIQLSGRMGKLLYFRRWTASCFLEVVERVECMSCVKILIILAVWALNFTVVTRCERSDQLMRDLSLFERALKERKIVGRRSAEAFRELKPVVGLDAFYWKSEPFKVIEHMNEKLRGGICAVLFKGFKVTVSWKLIDGGILIELFACVFPHEAGSRN